jgi:hypothetical protein
MTLKKVIVGEFIKKLKMIKCIAYCVEYRGVGENAHTLAFARAKGTQKSSFSVLYCRLRFGLHLLR